MAALYQKNCDFSHLRLGMAQTYTYNSPLLFYQLHSIQDVHSMILNLFDFVDPNKKD